MAIAKCACVGCNNEGTVKIKTNHQINGIWLCEHHAANVDGYTLEIDNFINKPKKHMVTFGQEFETAYTSQRARAILVENGYTPTFDSTVNVEYKSSINNGLMAFAQLFKSIDKLIESGDINLEVTENGRRVSCGTHMHVGHPLIDNGDVYDSNSNYALRNFYHTLFIPLSDVMCDNAAATKALYGRNFEETCWACPIDRTTSPVEHSNFINLQHKHTIEFRLCKYVNADQYMTLAKMHKEMVIAIAETFLMKYTAREMKFNNRVYTVKKEYRKAIATATAARLVNIYKKYARKAGFEI